MSPELRDIAWSIDGDIVITNGSIETVAGTSRIAQSIRNRLKTVNPDWFNAEIGADLEDFMGMRLDLRTASLLEQRIIESLTKDGLLDPSDVYVEVHPGTDHSLRVFLFVNVGDDDNPLGFEILIGRTTEPTIREVR